MTIEEILRIEKYADEITDPGDREYMLFLCAALQDALSTIANLQVQIQVVRNRQGFGRQLWSDVERKWK